MDRAAIIANLTSQLPSWADRQSVCRATGLVDVQLAGDAGAVWASIVEEAEAQGRLEALLLAAAKYRPRDRTLAVMAGLPAPAARGGSWGLWVALATLALMAGVARWQSPGGDVVEAPAALEVSAKPTPPPAAAPAEPAAVAAPAPVASLKAPEAAAPPAPPQAPEMPAVPAAPAAAAAPAPAVAAAAPPSAPAPTPAESVAPGAGRRGSCGGGGYAYIASGRAPGEGQTWTVPSSVYVRSDYPKASNGWDSKASVVCALPPGARVEMADAPLRIEGGAVWVRVRPDKILVP